MLSFWGGKFGHAFCERCSTIFKSLAEKMRAIQPQIRFTASYESNDACALATQSLIREVFKILLNIYDEASFSQIAPS